jgi:hypothetical protein
VPTIDPQTHLPSLEVNFQFNYKGTPLNSTEAAALLTLSHGNDPVAVDINKLVDGRRLNSKALFDMAVKQAKPELASLAWKISVHKEGTTETHRQIVPRTFARASSIQASADAPQAEEIIDKILHSQSNWAAGAALLISNLDKTEWTTLRHLATEFVNHCADFSLLPETSSAFKGFKRTEDNLYVPRDISKETPRRESFHVGSLYIGLRDGLIFCQKNGLTQVESDVATGYSTGEESRQLIPGALSRVYYKVRLSEKGAALQETWSDAEDHTIAIFASKLR